MAALRRAPALAHVAETAAFLASDRAGDMTGTIANVSCGWYRAEPSRPQLERRVLVGHEDECAGDDAVRPAAHADEVVEDSAWEATREEDREPRGDDREHRSDVERKSTT